LKSDIIAFSAVLLCFEGMASSKGLEKVSLPPGTYLGTPLPRKNGTLQVVGPRRI
jgi:hypothetical protein